MKAAGSYAGASGNAEVVRMDYQESRKSTALGFGLVLVVIVAIGAVIWLLVSKVTTAVKSPVTWAQETYQGAVDATVENATYPIPAVEAKNKEGNYYPVTAPEGLRQWLTDAGIAAPLVILGNTIAPAATKAGAESAQTVNRLGLNDAYVDLDPVTKSFVTFGQGVGKLVGVDLIQLGYDMRPQQ